MTTEYWDKRWMDTASQKGEWSKDRSRGVGAVVVTDDEDEVVIGWNGFCRKINDDVEERHQRPAKYLWSEHSERNAFYNAARLGRSTMNCRIYQTMYPCAHCARGIIQCGIKEVITYEPDWNDLTYADEFAVTKEMLTEAGVAVRFMAGTSPPRANSVASTQQFDRTYALMKFTKDDLVGWLGEFFGISDPDGTYAHWLTRVKSARSVGTLSIDDFEEFDTDNIDDLAEHILEKLRVK